ncbi:MAG: hypothetical protein RPR28_01545 [Cycloclasticus sp.]
MADKTTKKQHHTGKQHQPYRHSHPIHSIKIKQPNSMSYEWIIDTRSLSAFHASRQPRKTNIGQPTEQANTPLTLCDSLHYLILPPSHETPTTS